MSPFECPLCKQPCQQLIIPAFKGSRLCCRNCAGPKYTQYNPKLNQVFAQDSQTRLTNGKAWEIENRVVSKDDGKTIINRITGKPAQY